MRRLFYVLCIAAYTVGIFILGMLAAFFVDW